MSKFKNCFVNTGDLYKYEIKADADYPAFGIVKGDLLARAHSLNSHEKSEIEAKSFEIEVTGGEMLIKPKSSHIMRITTIMKALDSWEFGSEITEQSIGNLDESLQIMLYNAINQHELMAQERSQGNEKN